jgi:coenzyme F420-reducing hydrogenase delta subunit
LPPSFVEYALRDGAAGVVVTACAEGSCEYRLGQRWTAERLQGTREPHLRASVPRERLVMAWAGAGDESAVYQALQSLRQRITAGAGPMSASAAPVRG